MTNEEVKERLRDIAGLEDPLDRDDALKRLAATCRINASVLKEQLKKYTAEANRSQIQSPEDAAEQIDGIWLGSQRTRAAVIRDGISALQSTNNHYHYCNQITVLDKDKLKFVDTTSKMQATINKVKEAFNLTWDDKAKKWIPLYELYPRDLTDVLLAGDAKEQLPNVRIFTDVPILGPDYQPVPLGYDDVNQILRVGPDIAPRQGTTAIDRLLEEYDFASDADRTNYIALLLTKLIHHRLPGRVPMPKIEANQRGLGKTLLAQTLALIRKGRTSPTVTLTDNDEEVEKRLCSIARAGCDTFILDNAKSAKSLSLISSMVVERSITDDRLTFRLLGKNLDFDAENHHLFIVTTNGGQMSPDLISRHIPINLHYEGDPNKRTFKNQEYYEFVKKIRLDVYAEILGHFEKWRQAGMPRADVRHRFQTWAEVIGGVLRVNGHKEFLANQGSSSAASDGDYQAFCVLSQRCTPDKANTAAELLKTARSGGLYAKLDEIPEERARNVAFGKILSRFIGAEFRLDDTRLVRLEKAEPDANKTARYVFSKVAETPEAVRSADVIDLRRQKTNSSETLSPTSGDPEEKEGGAANSEKERICAEEEKP